MKTLKFTSLVSQIAQLANFVKDKVLDLMDGAHLTREEAFKVVIDKHYPKAPEIKTVAKPKSTRELRALIKESKVNPAQIDVSNISDFSHVFEGVSYDDWSFLKYWNLQYIKVDTTNGIHFSDFAFDLTSMFEGSNINDTARFGNWFSAWPVAIWLAYRFANRGVGSLMVLNARKQDGGMIDNLGWDTDHNHAAQILFCNRLRATSSLDCIAKASFDNMFRDCHEFSGMRTGIKRWCMEPGVSFANMFSGCAEFRADLSQWGVGLGYTRPGSFRDMLHGCDKFDGKLNTWFIRWDSSIDEAFDKENLYKMNAPFVWFVHNPAKADGYVMNSYLN